MTIVKLPQRPLGSQGLQASAQGLGIMSFGNTYADPKHQPTEKENQEVLNRALDLGCNFIDTADVYGFGISEEQLAIALKGRREQFVVATKFGNAFTPATPKSPGGRSAAQGVEGSPAYIRKALEDSLRRLGTDYIDLYYQHRVDRTRPIEETWQELKKLVEEGKVKYLGISEATPEEIKRAHAIHPITAVQLEWSLFTRNVEEEIIPLLRDLGIGIVPYSPLGRGVLTGSIASVADLHEDDRRRKIPRFSDENFEHNVQLVAKLKDIAASKGVTASQLALAWVHAQGEDVFPIPGTKRVKYVEENIAAFHVKLTKEEVKHLSDLFHPDAVKGGRSDEAMRKHQFEAHR